MSTAPLFLSSTGHVSTRLLPVDRSFIVPLEPVSASSMSADTARQARDEGEGVVGCHPAGVSSVCGAREQGTMTCVVFFLSAVTRYCIF